MSDTPATPAAPVAAPVAAPAAAAPAPKLNAIQLIEQEIGNFLRQREQAVANVHAVDGAIQAAQRLLGILKAEAAKAEAEGKKLLADAETEGKEIVTAVEGEASKVVDFIKKEV